VINADLSQGFLPVETKEKHKIYRDFYLTGIDRIYRINKLYLVYLLYLVHFVKYPVYPC